MIELPIDEARTGDVVLFRMRQGAIAKHAGILTNERQNVHRFIHAYERTGVIEENLTEPWRRRIAFAFRFPVPEREEG